MAAEHAHLFQVRQQEGVNQVPSETSHIVGKARDYWEEAEALAQAFARRSLRMQSAAKWLTLVSIVTSIGTAGTAGGSTVSGLWQSSTVAAWIVLVLGLITLLGQGIREAFVSPNAAQEMWDKRSDVSQLQMEFQEVIERCRRGHDLAALEKSLKATWTELSAQTRDLVASGLTSVDREAARQAFEDSRVYVDYSSVLAEPTAQAAEAEQDEGASLVAATRGGSS